MAEPEVAGIDCPVNCTKYADGIKTAGKAFVGRYYRKTTSSFPALKKPEVDALHAAGLKVVALWESASTTTDYFSYARGVDDGTSAYHQALLAGQPPQTPIYFAVDYDASAAALAGPVSDYFRGVKDGYGTISQGAPVYDVGVYGSGQSCGWLKMHGWATHAWLAVSKKWTGHDTYTDWNIVQGPQGADLGFDHDTNQAVGAYGGF